MLEGIVFWLCGGLMLLGGIMTVASRSAVGAAIWLIFAFLNAAGLFALLSAPFLAVLQVLVYAGAIMVLFLFVIMMLHGPVLGAELHPQGRWVWPAVALPAASLLISGAILLGGRGGGGFRAAAPAGFGRAERVAALLLDRYLLAFELISVVLLVAIVGAVSLGLAPEEAVVTIGLTHYLALAGAVFVTGLVGVLTRRNTLILFMCIELMLSAANLVFAAFSRQWGDASGHVFVLMSFAVAAAEAAIGLAILVEIHRLRRTVNVDDLKTLME